MIVMYVFKIACVAATITLFQPLIQTYNFSTISRHFRLYIQTYWPHFGLLVLENLVTRSVEFHTKKKIHKKLPLKMQLFHFANNHFYCWMQLFFSVSLAASPPRDLQITAYKLSSAHVQCCHAV